VTEAGNTIPVKTDCGGADKKLAGFASSYNGRIPNGD